MMFIIRKMVAENTYYWNDRFKRWEGLEDNATSVNKDRLEILMRNFLFGWDPKQYSFFNLYRTKNIV